MLFLSFTWMNVKVNPSNYELYKNCWCYYFEHDFGVIIIVSQSFTKFKVTWLIVFLLWEIEPNYPLPVNSCISKKHFVSLLEGNSYKKATNLTFLKIWKNSCMNVWNSVNLFNCSTGILGSCGVLINIQIGPTNKIYTYFGSGYMIAW